MSTTKPYVYDIVTGFPSDDVFRTNATFALRYSGDQSYSLWCYVSKITPESIVFYVINGAWEGQLRRDFTAICDRFPEDVFAVDLIRIGDIPAFRRWEYEAAFRWLRDPAPDVDYYSQYLARAVSFEDMDDDIAF